MISPSHLARRRTEKGTKTLRVSWNRTLEVWSSGISFPLFCLFGTFDRNVLEKKKKKTLTRIFIILFGDSLQQCVQSEGVILHDPVGDAAEERVRVQPGTVVATSVPVTAQHFLIKEALTCGRILKVGLVKSRYDHGQLEILHLLQ